MKLKSGQARNYFQILCIWCGANIRHDKSEDSYGVCLKCFYRILNDYLRAQRRANKLQFASER